MASADASRQDCFAISLRDEADGGILPFEPSMLLSAAHAEGSLADDFTYVPVPNRRARSLDGHLFADTTQPLIEAVSAWLSERHL